MSETGVRIAILIAAIVPLMAAGRTVTNVLTRTVVCGGAYGGHLQGVATDGANLFWSFTVALVKTDGDGNVLATRTVASHHGDLCCVDGVVYVAVNLGQFNQETGADSHVWAYRASDLEPSGRWDVPELVHGAGGMTHWNGRFYVVGGLPTTHDVNYVYEYDPAFNFIARHELASGYTSLGIQTAHEREGRFLFGIYGTTGNPAGTLSCGTDFGSLERSDVNGSYGLVDLEGWEGVASTGTTSAGNTGKIVFTRREVREVTEPEMFPRCEGASASVGLWTGAAGPASGGLGEVDTRRFDEETVTAAFFSSVPARGAIVLVR